VNADRPCIAFTGGGTGGHVYPGLAVIEALRERWSGRIVWIGSGKEVERAAVEAAGVEFFSVPSGKLRRSLSPRNVADAFKVAAGYFASRRLLKRLKPLVLFSKGGYVSVAPCLAASSLGIPYFTHESDVSPGLATRINARKAGGIVLSWEASLAFLSEEQKERALVAGNPVRKAMQSGDAGRGRAWLGFADTLPVLLVLGGSQGARQVNDLINAILPELQGKAAVAHQTGAGNAPLRAADGGYKGFEFVHGELPDLMAAADIIVGRAGAGTVWESSANGKPMVLIPLAGYGTRGDQVENARLLEKAGAAIALVGDDAAPAKLLAAVLELAGSPERRAAMAAAARKAAKPGAAGLIADYVLNKAQVMGAGRKDGA
jgi:UDP-N-acetylglucosamine--N-acetylmuramyl-(pentapeptide) pyrophosphoryl-undecaprenol N-acetylglucosamine transferase